MKRTETSEETYHYNGMRKQAVLSKKRKHKATSPVLE